ncbi:hypothetical protein [Paucisalibacillus sp. EB02]|uniref:hypothetical protein n=1 Tax=Paucisalibacillus sp. EB02 TaxID=1347087 RepID=UPI0005A767AF|nr:hypothetical protein [Paucisalibacillus sp. EB02]
MQGIIVVGVGMPQIILEKNMIRDFFQSGGLSGFDYAYGYPGVNKVLQAGESFRYRYGLEINV